MSRREFETYHHRIKLPDGEQKTYHENGMMASQTFYCNGKINGERKQWHSNGRLCSRVFYKDSRWNGKYESWYNTGQICVLAFYRNSVLEGEHKIWSENGKLRVHEFCRNGNVVDRKFSSSKRCAFVKFIKHCRSKIVRPVNNVLISDLTNLVSRFW